LLKESGGSIEVKGPVALREIVREARKRIVGMYWNASS